MGKLTTGLKGTNRQQLAFSASTPPLTGRPTAGPPCSSSCLVWPDTPFPPLLVLCGLIRFFLLFFLPVPCELRSLVLDYVMPFKSAAAAVTAVVPGLSGYMGCMVYQNI